MTLWVLNWFYIGIENQGHLIYLTIVSPFLNSPIFVQKSALIASEMLKYFLSQKITLFQK